AGNKTTLAPYVSAGLFWNTVRMMHGTGVVIVHAPHPVWQPGGANFQKDEFDSRVLFHDAAPDEGHDADHQIERHANHVNIEIGIFEAFLTWAIEAAGDPVHADGDAEVVGFTEERLEERIVEIARANGARDHRADEPKIFDRSVELLGCHVWVLKCDGGDAAHTAVERFRFLGGVVVVSAAHRGGKITVVQMRRQRHDVRISDLNVDALFVQIIEPALHVVESRRVDRHVGFTLLEKITVGGAMSPVSYRPR